MLRICRFLRSLPCVVPPTARLLAAGSLLSGWGASPALAQTSPALSIHAEADVATIPVGKAVTVSAMASLGDRAAVGEELWAYLDGRQWGAQAITDSTGHATFILPLPLTGDVRLEIALKPEGFRWPTETFGQTADFTVGTPLPPGSVTSNALHVAVMPRTFAPTLDPAHLVGTTWYPWFTRYNAHIDGGHGGAEGVPLLGSYAASNPDVIRQQMLWLDEIGVNFVQVDWSNNLSSSVHWRDHPPGVDEMVASTRALLDTLVAMRAEGLPTPQVILLLGMAPPFSLAALNEELHFVRDTFLADPGYSSLFLRYEGKPLTTVLSVLTRAELAKLGPVDRDDFTVRWEWVGVADRPGWWSWTDPYLPPTMAYHDGHAEALTVTAAFSAGTGWRDPKSLGKRGGSTWVRGFRTALEHRPEFLILQQFNEWGEQYDAELSSDFEPASLASLGRGQTGGDGGAGFGWGFSDLNLLRALVAIYHGQASESTVLTVAAPLRDQVVAADSLHVEWQALGQAAASYCVALDGKKLAEELHGNSCDLTLVDCSPGPHKLTVVANGAFTRFPLSRAVDAEPTAHAAECAVTVPFVRK